MIGQGRYRSLTRELNHPSVPHGPMAEQFSANLTRRTGAMLVWNRQRRVFCVVRDRGRHVPVVSYFDITMTDLPFSASLLHHVCNAVGYYMAQQSGDPIKMQERLAAIGAAEHEREKQAVIDEFVPEFARAIRRANEVMSDGRYRPKHFDLAGKRLRASAA